MSIHIDVYLPTQGGAEVDYRGNLRIKSVGGTPRITIHSPSNEQVADALVTGTVNTCKSDHHANGFFYTIDVTLMGLDVTLFPSTEQLWEVATVGHMEAVTI